MANPENIVIYWWISCFDKRKEDPLPVYTRGFVLDESRATDEQKVSILKLIRGSEPTSLSILWMLARRWSQLATEFKDPTETY